MDDHEQRAKKLLTLIGEKEERTRLTREQKQWQGALIEVIVAACLLAAGSIAYLSLEAEIKAVGSTANQVGLLKQQMAALNQRGQVAVLGVRIDQLSAAKAQLEADVALLKGAIETMKAEKKKASPARRR